MKIYIVTTGSYSDYSIDKVFTNKDLAYNYFNELEKTSNDARLEEYDSDEDVTHLVAKEAFKANIDWITGHIEEGEVWNHRRTSENRFHLVDKNTRVPSYQDKDNFTIEYLTALSRYGGLVYNSRYSYVSQEHVNKLIAEERQKLLRLLNQLNLKLDQDGWGNFKLTKV